MYAVFWDTLIGMTWFGNGIGQYFATMPSHADKLNASESESGALKEKLAQLESMLGGPALELIAFR